MGYIYVNAVFYNPIDYTDFVLGKCRLEDVERISLKALVDTGATFPALPEDVVEKHDPSQARLNLELYEPGFHAVL